MDHYIRRKAVAILIGNTGEPSILHRELCNRGVVMDLRTTCSGNPRDSAGQSRHTAFHAPTTYGFGMADEA